MQKGGDHMVTAFYAIYFFLPFFRLPNVISKI